MKTDELERVAGDPEDDEDEEEKKHEDEEDDEDDDEEDEPYRFARIPSRVSWTHAIP
jgi:hypothetical protein